MVSKAEPEAGGEHGKFRLSFSDVSINASLPNGETKLIMDGVSGTAQTGQVMALMGPTGSGKTTLLNALANRLDPGVILNTNAKISYGGKPWHRGEWERATNRVSTPTGTQF